MSATSYRRKGSGAPSSARLSASAKERRERDMWLERLEAYVVGRPAEAKYLNASNRGVSTLDGLRRAPRVETLILRGNGIRGLSGLDQCRELWNVDLAHNRVSDLSGLEKFSALGELDLTSNAVTWPELFKLKHLQLLSLTLVGNPIEQDEKYRYHVIDILPSLWSLDGVLISSAERSKVKSYFSSVATNPKLRRKQPRVSYTPTSMRNVALTGLHGVRTVALSRTFPRTLTHSADLDFQRLLHLCSELEEKLLVTSNYRWSKTTPPTLMQIPSDQSIMLKPALKLRGDRRNMLYFLMVSMLVYTIPGELLSGTLKLTGIGDDMEGLFYMPVGIRAQFAALLGSVTDLFVGKTHEESLYPQLRRCLQQFTNQALRASSSRPRRSSAFKRPIAEADRYSNQFRMSANARGRISLPTPAASAAPSAPAIQEQFGNLLAVELGQLLCLVPEFSDCVGQSGDSGLIKIFEECTVDPHIYAKLMALLSKQCEQSSRARPGSPDFIPEETTGADFSEASPSPTESEADKAPITRVVPFLMERIHKDAVAAESGQGSVSSLADSSSQSVFEETRALERVTSASPTRSYSRASSAAFRRSTDYRIGETVYTSTGQTARIIAMPTSTVVHLQFNPFTAPFRAEIGGPTFEQVHITAITRDSRGRLQLSQHEGRTPRVASRRAKSAMSSHTRSRSAAGFSRRSSHTGAIVEEFAWQQPAEAEAEVVSPPTGEESDEGEGDEILYRRSASPDDGYEQSIAQWSRPPSSGDSRPQSAGDFAAFSGVSVQVTLSRADRPTSRTTERPRTAVVPSVVSLNNGGDTKPGSQPGSGRPGSGRPGSGRPSSGRPTSGRPASGRPGSGRPSSGRKPRRSPSPQSPLPAQSSRAGADSSRSPRGSLSPVARATSPTSTQQSAFLFNGTWDVVHATSNRPSMSHRGPAANRNRPRHGMLAGEHHQSTSESRISVLGARLLPS